MSNKVMTDIPLDLKQHRQQQLPVMNNSRSTATTIESNQMRENDNLKESLTSSSANTANNAGISSTCSCQSSFSYSSSASSSWGVKNYSFSCPHHLSSHCLPINTASTTVPSLSCQGGHDVASETRDSSSTFFPGIPRDDSCQQTTLRQTQGCPSSSQEFSPSKDPGKPPPLPPKKKNVMAYMTVVGSYRGPSDAALSMYRHSVHAHHGCNRRDSPRAGGVQALRQLEMSFVPQRSLDSSVVMVQPMRPITVLSNQANIVDVSSIALPTRSVARSSVSSSSTDDNSISDRMIPSPPSQGPTLPPKTFRRKVSPPQLPLEPSSNVSSRFTPTTAILSSPTDVPDVVSSTTNGDNKVIISNGSPQKSLSEQESEPLNEMDVNRFLIFKSPDEDGPEIKGGPVDALVVKATEVSKNGLFVFQPFSCLSKYF
jgi:hypothetical protein